MPESRKIIIDTDPGQDDAVAMLLAFAILWSLRKRGYAAGWLFGLYLILAGVERFLVEFVRAKDDRLLGAFTLAQFTSAVIVLIGVWLMLKWRRAADPAPGTYLETGKAASLSKA